MDEGEIRRQIETDLTAVPYVSGVNNHMGSRFMEDEAGLAVMMEELAKKGLFFVDSLTTPDSRHARQPPGQASATRRGPSHRPYTGTIRQPWRTSCSRPRGAGAQEKPLLMIGHPRPKPCGR